MPSWAELQPRMAAALLGPPGDEALAAIAHDGLAPAARLAIYRHHVLTSLTAALAATYPAVVRLVGDGFFRYAASRFIPAHPPRGPCLAEYGDALAGFLAGFPPCRHLAWLPDVARLEWAINVALQAADPAPIAPAALHDVAPGEADRLILRLRPDLAWIASRWPVDRIWETNQPGASPDAVVDLAAGPVRLEVSRSGDGVVIRRLSAGIFALRRALGTGRPLGPAAEAALGEEPGLDLAAALAGLLAEGAVTGYTLAAGPPVPA